MEATSSIHHLPFTIHPLTNFEFRTDVETGMRQTRQVRVKDVLIGGGAPVAVQSMTKTDTSDVEGTVRQIEEMVRQGCEIVRVAVPNAEAAVALKEIRRRVPDVPLVADIHFHYRLALMALEAGIDKLRLNPGNIGSIERVREVVRATKERGVPIRLGVTEAGTPFGGTIKSSIGLGILLHEGIGDTIRVSLAAEPWEEVRVGWEILKSLELRKRGVTVVACPTCGRLDIDNFVEIVTEVERRLAHVEEPLHLSIMGCEVNGPGEAHDSQLGVTFGKGVGMIFKDGRPMRKVSGANIVEAFVNEAERLVAEGADAQAEATPELVQI